MTVVCSYNETSKAMKHLSESQPDFTYVYLVAERTAYEIDFRYWLRQKQKNSKTL